MKPKKRLYAFFNSSETFALIEADSKKQARERATLIKHLSAIPADCRVKKVPRITIRRAPLFFDGHFVAIEDALAEASS